MAVIPKFSLPFQWGTTGAAVVEQDSGQEILNCAYAIVATPQGSREENPDFGVPDAAFSRSGTNRATVERIVNELEPRAVAIVEESPDLLDSLIDNIRVSVTGGA